MQPTHPQQDQESAPQFSHFLNNDEAASYLAYTSQSLRRSRMDNRLAGVVPPAYIKRGSRVFYRLEDLDKWMGQFIPQTSTDENKKPNLKHPLLFSPIAKQRTRDALKK